MAVQLSVCDEAVESSRACRAGRWFAGLDDRGGECCLVKRGIIARKCDDVWRPINQLPLDVTEVILEEVKGQSCIPRFVLIFRDALVMLANSLLKDLFDRISRIEVTQIRAI